MTESLNIGGVLKGGAFTANGSLLNNVSLVDKNWLMNGFKMINMGYRLGIDTTSHKDNI